MIKLFVLLIIFFLKGIASLAQLNQIEVTSGFDKSAVSHFSSLPASGKSGININTLAFFQKYHRPEDEFLDEAGLQLSIFKQLSSSLSAGPTFYYNSFAGMMEKLSLQYLKVGPRYIILLMPSVGYANKDKAFISELFFQLQYQVRLSGKWHLISYLQGLTNWIKLQSDIKLQSHNRSFQYVRFGLSESSGWQFGLALDFDHYGPDPNQESTPGIFLRKVFIHN